MRVTGSRIAYANPWLRIREDDVVYPDGATAMFGVVEKGDFAVVVPAEADGYWLVRQWRHAVGRQSWEFPAGGWPPSYTGERDPEQLARRELREETGLTAGRLEHLGRLAPVIGLVQQWMDVWLASDLTPGEPDREPSEQGMVSAFVTRAELVELVRTGELVDAQSLAALTLLELR